MNTALATLDSFSDRIAALDARWILVALALPPRQPGLPRARVAGHPPRRLPGRADSPARRRSGLRGRRRRQRATCRREAARRSRSRSSASGSPARPSPASAPRAASILLFDAVVGATLLGTAWALGLVPALPHPSPLVAARGGSRLSSSPRSSSRRSPSAREPPAGRRDPGDARVSTSARRSRTRRRVGLPDRRRLRHAGRVRRSGDASRSPGWSSSPAGCPRSCRPPLAVPERSSCSIVVALQQVASAASALSFSIGMQVGVTVVNTLVGLARDHARLRDDAPCGDQGRAVLPTTCLGQNDAAVAAADDVQPTIAAKR